MDSLSVDTYQLKERLKLGKVHFAGLSLGGFVTMRLAARRLDLIKSAILIETSSQPEPNAAKYTFLSTMVKLFGISPSARI